MGNEKEVSTILAIVDVAVPVELRERLRGKPRPSVEPVAVLGDEVLQPPCTMKRDECHVRHLAYEKGFGVMTITSIRYLP